MGDERYLEDEYRLIRSEKGKRGDKKGKTNERLVDEALDRLQESGQIISHWYANQFEERSGLDQTIMTAAGDVIPLQVKSSIYNASDALSRHPEVPCIVVEEGDDLGRIQTKILELLGSQTSD